MLLLLISILVKTVDLALSPPMGGGDMALLSELEVMEDKFEARDRVDP